MARAISLAVSVTIPAIDLDSIDRKARGLGISRPEAIRRAVSEFISDVDPDTTVAPWPIRPPGIPTA